MDKNLLAALDVQVGVEHYAEASYRNMRFWAKAAGWRGFAKWCERAQHGEHDDGHSLLSLAVRCGEFPAIPSMTAPESKYKGLADALGFVAGLEATNFTNLSKLHDLAVKVGDVVVTVHLEEMLTEQQESKTKTALLKARADEAGSDPAALRMLDKYLAHAKP